MTHKQTVVTEEMVSARMDDTAWPDMSGMTRDEKKLEYATRFAAQMRELDPTLPLEHTLNGSCGGWATAEMQLRIEEMSADGMTDDEIQGACTAYECMTGVKSGIVGSGPVVP